MDELAFHIGRVVMVSGAVITGILLLAWLFYALNRLQKEMVGHFYGWKYFLEFVDWYHKNKKP